MCVHMDVYTCIYMSIYTYIHICIFKYIRCTPVRVERWVMI